MLVALGPGALAKTHISDIRNPGKCPRGRSGLSVHGAGSASREREPTPSVSVRPGVLVRGPGASASLARRVHSALTAPGPHGCSRGPSADRLVLEASLPACRAISSPRPHRAVPLCVRVLISSPHKDIRDIGQGLQPCFALRGMSNYSHVRGAGVRASACGFEGSQFSPQQG